MDWVHWYTHPSSAESWAVGTLVKGTVASAVSVALGQVFLQYVPNCWLWESVLLLQVIGLLGIMAAPRLGPVHEKWGPWLVALVHTMLLIGASFATVLPPRSTGDTRPRGFLGIFAWAVSHGIGVSMILWIVLVTFRNGVLLRVRCAYHILRRAWERRWHHPRHVLCEDLEAQAPGPCPVCLVDLVEEEGAGVLRLACMHTFHEPCISAWFDKRSDCPVCRRPVGDLRRCAHLCRSDKKAATLSKPSPLCHIAGPPAMSPALSDASTTATVPMGLLWSTVPSEAGSPSSTPPMGPSESRWPSASELFPGGELPPLAEELPLPCIGSLARPVARGGASSEDPNSSAADSPASFQSATSALEALELGPPGVAEAWDLAPHSADCGTEASAFSSLAAWAKEEEEEEEDDSGEDFV